MYESIYQYYRQRLQTSASELSLVKKKIYLLGTLRLLVFVAASLSAFLLWTQGALIIVAILFLGVSLFIALLLQYNKFQQRKDYLETACICDEQELKALDYDFSTFDGAPEKENAGHFFSLDLDIFGANSLFQSINRTCTDYGKKVLANWFEKPLQTTVDIQNRQKAVKELLGKDFFLHHFRVSGLVNRGKDSDYEEIKNFINQPDFISGKKIWKLVGLFFPCLWMLLIICFCFQLFHSNVLIISYIIALFISESQLRKVGKIQSLVGKKISILYSYSDLIETIENEEFRSESLRELKAAFFKENRKASFRFKKLAQLANELEQRNNFLVHLLFNPLILWDIRKSIKIEDCKSNNGKDLMDWIKALGKFDAYCSLSTFAFNHPDYIFPSLTDTYFEISACSLGHPLMNRDTFVRNDICIKQHPYFMIITGANMAGKSTYLRTVGVNYVLACIGTPVCAESMLLYPACLITGLRTSDSLLDNESYFFAELKRLKMIIEQLQAGEKVFIILDEILKGTNSIDKQKGSLALIRQFIHLQTGGIIATHDLLLGNLEEEFPDNIKNSRFEADIKNDELVFSYKLQDGIAQNMNATFLMQKMGITINAAFDRSL